ncbi:MAG TPA: SAM-dependent methyltransferase [Trebonia sp.]
MEGRISARVPDGHPGGPTGIDRSVANVARIYDYWLGGRENFQADRATAEQLVKLVPEAQYTARDNRAFLHRAVRFLAERGITQFLDIGTGMPGPTTVLDTAREVNPDCRVAYVDYDPIVVSHGRALLTKSRQAIVVQADIRQPRAVLGHPSIREHLDFGQPVTVLLLAVLHFISDDDDPPAIIAAVRDALAPGSYLAIGHVTHDNAPDEMVSAAIAAFAKTSAGIWPRTASQIGHLFNGFDLVEPGLVPAHTWWPDPGGPPIRENTLLLGGVARKA